MPRRRKNHDRTEVVDFRIEKRGPIDPFRFRSREPKVQMAAFCFYNWWIENPDKHFEGPADIRVVYTWYGPLGEDLIYEVFRWIPCKY